MDNFLNCIAVFHLFDKILQVTGTPSSVCNFIKVLNHSNRIIEMFKPNFFRLFCLKKLQVRKTPPSGTPSQGDDHRSSPMSARDYVESLHQNNRSQLLYGKNNVFVQPVGTYSNDVRIMMMAIFLNKDYDMLCLWQSRLD